MTPEAIGALVRHLPPASVARREAAREQLLEARASGTLLEAEPDAIALAPPMAGVPEIGQWARLRSRCEGHFGHARHRAHDKPAGAWHLVKHCKWAERGQGCCPIRGSCGASLRGEEAYNGHSAYLEVAAEAPAGACRKCVDRLERQRRAAEQLRELVGR